MPRLLLIAVLLWYLGASLAAFLALVWDKRRARCGGRRLRERTLLNLMWAGGAAGGLLAMRMARHKTRRRVFRLTGVASVLLHAGAWIALVLWLA